MLLDRIKIIIIICFWSQGLSAQLINQQVEIKLDNDKLFLVDRYYTNGLFISYKRELENSFVLKKTSNNTLQLNITIGNETYTPRGLSSFDVNDFDRPFAGWLFGKFEIGTIQANSAFFVAIETGITGKESLSGKLQTAIHDLFNIDNPTWEEEIAYKWLVNIKARYLFSLMEANNNALLCQIGSSIGSKDVFVENGIQYYFGTFNDLKNSSRLGLIDRSNTNEFYGSMSLAYKFVAHNTVIEGSIFSDDVLFTTNASKHVFSFKMACVLKRNSHTIKLVGSVNSKETPWASYHTYGSLIYSKDF